MTKVIDIFAGPGGLSEGFASVIDHRGEPVFDAALSIEIEPLAFETLKLRTFFRLFEGDPHVDYYRFLRQEIDLDALYSAHPAEAKEAAARCWKARLGPKGESALTVRKRIDKALGGDDPWVLIGGPPCQAYSLAGRSRNRGEEDYDPEADVRQRLYVEYLQILADHRPSIFVMENVKGLLSATLRKERIFHRILDDLRNPVDALKREGRTTRYKERRGYRIYSLTEPLLFENGNADGAVIQAEKYGIPQSRHRVILLGIRDDYRETVPGTLKERPPVSVSAVIGSLPKLRSGLSQLPDSPAAWTKCLRSQVNSRWANAGTRRVDTNKLSDFIRSSLRRIEAPVGDRGGEFVQAEAICTYMREWYCDARIEGVCNHQTRGHIEKDLFRYLYASCYASLYGTSPTLRHFPTDLHPNHENVGLAIKEGGNFTDRFRVQVNDRPSTTIVSHISKDGHYYIHPDPKQCRSLTVREAARLQTFPDNYFFCGPRTAQYVQVGNAVPPLLARQIGEIISDILKNP